MNEGGAQGAVRAKQGALGDITNTYGKRAVPMESEKNKVGRYQGTLQTGYENGNFKTNFCGLEGKTKGKEKINHESEVIEDVNGPKGRKGPCQFLPLDIGGGFIRKKVGLHIPEDDIVEADWPTPGCVYFGYVPQICNDTRESSPELDNCREDDKNARENSVHSDIQTEKGHDKSSTAIYRVLDSVVLKGKTVDSGECLTQDTVVSLNHSLPLEAELTDEGELLKASVPSNVGSSNNCEGTTGSDENSGCSFCLKAAYMWMDLHYQDTRGRLAALKKSKKFARSLEARCYGHDPPVNIAQDKSKRYMEKDFELMQHCRSLFLHMENVLVRETAQLHSTLVRLKEEREDYKSRLANISVVHPSKR